MAFDELGLKEYLMALSALSAWVRWQNPASVWQMANAASHVHALPKRGLQY